MYADALRGFCRLESDPAKQLKYLDFIDMYLTLDEEERKVYHLKYPEEAKTMSRFAERFRDEGRDEGMQDMLLDALNVKFHSVPQDIREKILGLKDQPKLKDLHRHAILSNDIKEFKDKLSQVSATH